MAHHLSETLHHLETQPVSACYLECLHSIADAYEDWKLTTEGGFGVMDVFYFLQII